MIGFSKLQHGGMKMVAWFLLVGIALILLGLVVFLIAAKSGGKAGKGLAFTGLVIVVCSIFIWLWQANDRESRTHTVIGRLVSVRYQETDYGCDELFNISVQDCPDGNGYCDHELPYTFALRYPLVCPSNSTTKKYGVVEVTFVAPKSDDGRPEILRWINLNWEVSYRSGSRCTPEPQPSK